VQHAPPGSDVKTYQQVIKTCGQRNRELRPVVDPVHGEVADGSMAGSTGRPAPERFEDKHEVPQSVP